MITLEQVKLMIEKEIPGAEVKVQDLTGTGDHLQATVVSSQFEGKSLVKQHQLVFAAVKQSMDSGAIHALALKTYTPEAWKSATQTA